MKERIKNKNVEERKEELWDKGVFFRKCINLRLIQSLFTFLFACNTKMFNAWVTLILKDLAYSPLTRLSVPLAH